MGGGLGIVSVVCVVSGGGFIVVSRGLGDDGVGFEQELLLPVIIMKRRAIDEINFIHFRIFIAGLNARLFCFEVDNRLICF